LSPTAARLPSAPRLGKFELRRLLGRGGQSAVHLGYDTQLQREVAIKLLKKSAAGQSLLNEARSASRLRHANVVPIYEAGESEGSLYLVFEYVPGRTLDQLLREEGALPAARARELMIGILAAVEHAHAAGLLHRDLKPSNILIDVSGTPRVMDFGIATGVDAHSPDGLLGTPAYMAPEYIVSQTLSPQYDVFAAGLILYEMVFGRRAVSGDNAFQAMHQIANMPLVFPTDVSERADSGLLDVIAKATAKDRELRYPSAKVMREALEAQLRLAAEAAATATTPEAQQSTLDFLLRRMRVKSDFPAMSAAIDTIQRLASSDKADASTLSNSILKDFALTNKLLRLVNSAYYPLRSGERISTVSRAIVILGFNAVRSVALSLMLFDHIRDKKHADTLREEFLRANFRGILARDLGSSLVQAQTEEAFICALFLNLGRLLTHFYFWEEAEMIGRLMATEKCSEQAASLRVLGISYQDLGIGIARSWGFPDTIVQSMRKLPEGKPPRGSGPEQRLQLVSAFANELGGLLESAEPEQREAEIGRLVSRFGDALPLNPRQVAAVISQSVKGVQELAGTLGIDLRQSALRRRIADVPAGEASAPPGSHPVLEASPGLHLLGSEAAEPPPSRDSQAILSAGIQDISQALIADCPLADLLRIVAETIYRAVELRRVLICLRDARTGRMQARFGFGAAADAEVARFQFPLGGADLFNAILARDSDVLIRDAGEPKIAARLPDWYRQLYAAPSFIIFPIRIQNLPVAMIYADHERPGGISLAPAELSLLHTLRNQAALAIKQAR